MAAAQTFNRPLIQRRHRLSRRSAVYDRGMKRSLIFGLALLCMPIAASAQSAPSSAPAAVPAAPGRPALSAQQQAAMQQLRAEFAQSRTLTRTRLLQALTPAHRTAVANIVGQLALSASPNPKAAVQALDAMLAPAEKQSILNIAAADKQSMETLRQQQMSVIAASLTADQKAAMAQRQAQRQAYMQSHPRAAHVPDPGAIVLRTLGAFGGPEGAGGPGGAHAAGWMRG